MDSKNSDKFCLVITTCNECGLDPEVYGLFDTYEEALNFNLPDNSAYSTTCGSKNIVELNKEMR